VTVLSVYVITLAQPRGAEDTGPPKLGSQENSWLRRWAKYTKLCMVWQPNILNNCYELSGGCAPPKPPTRGSALDPAGGLPFPWPPVPPTPNPGYATALLFFFAAWSRALWPPSVFKHTRYVNIRIVSLIVSYMYARHRTRPRSDAKLSDMSDDKMSCSAAAAAASLWLS